MKSKEELQKEAIKYRNEQFKERIDQLEEYIIRALSTGGKRLNFPCNEYEYDVFKDVLESSGFCDISFSSGGKWHSSRIWFSLE